MILNIFFIPNPYCLLMVTDWRSEKLYWKAIKNKMKEVLDEN